MILCNTSLVAEAFSHNGFQHKLTSLTTSFTTLSLFISFLLHRALFNLPPNTRINRTHYGTCRGRLYQGYRQCHQGQGWVHFPYALNPADSPGLGRLRWYCQICEKQMRDENGFQAHCRSEPHLRKIIAVGPKAGATIAEFSRQFQYEFLSLLKSRHNTQRVRANAVYNEYIQDKEHVHMNATRWVTLSGFVGTLGKAGIVKVDEDDKGLWIQWIDNTPKTLQKQVSGVEEEGEYSADTSG